MRDWSREQFEAMREEPHDFNLRELSKWEVLDDPIFGKSINRGDREMPNALDDFKEDLSKMNFGISRAEAFGQGICLQCREKALAKCYSDAGKREYFISGLCEECFDELFEK